ncbi:MAG: PAS domain S-box protein, partial [Actinobacteria bacterium]|nr:PAS domain S-box protein [Actinomycetota bacterium]
MSGDAPIHPTLARQLRRLGIDPAVPPDVDGWLHLLRRISSAYTDADNDRYTLERAIEISSREMQLLHDDLAEREQFRSAIVEGAAEGVITIDADGTILSFNAAASEIFGWEASEIVGQPLSVLVPEAHRHRHEAGFQRYLTTGQPVIMGRTVEVEGLRRSGEMFP